MMKSIHPKISEILVRSIRIHIVNASSFMTTVFKRDYDDPKTIYLNQLLLTNYLNRWPEEERKNCPYRKDPTNQIVEICLKRNSLTTAYKETRSKYIIRFVWH